MKKGRNDTLDLLKLFASFAVVFIHVFFYGKISIVTDSLARFAVPLFFAATGFYSYGITPDKIKKRAAYLMRLLAFAVVLCVSSDVLLFFVYNDTPGIVYYFNQFLDLKNILNILVYNTPIHAVHLWYLLAVLYVYVIFYFVKRYNVKDNIIFAIGIILLIVHLILAEGFSAFGIIIPTEYIRNFLFMGFPFFTLGLMANKYADKLEKLNGAFIFVFGIFGALTTLLSRKFFGKNELYLGSILIVFALFLIFIKYSHIRYNKVIVAIASCSTFVYILHTIVSDYLYVAYWKLGIEYSVALELAHPFLVCLFSTILALGVKNIDRFLRAK